MKYLKFLIPLGLFLVLAGFLAVGLNLNPREVPSPLIGKPAPGFDLTMLDAPDQKLKRDELLGKVWVLNVWASWCAPCREEHPLVVELARRKLAPVYGLNYKDTRPAGLAFLGQLAAYGLRCSTPTAASASTTVSTACRDLSWSTNGAPSATSRSGR